MLERCRRLRTIGNERANGSLQRISRPHILKPGGRLGVIRNRHVLVAESEEERQLLQDLALYSRRSGASAIERCSRSVRAHAGSEERAVLDAMCDARLLQLAKMRGEDFQLLLIRYASERLLYRLAQAPYRSRSILKGEALFST
jgi:hypothetical protein